MHLVRLMSYDNITATVLEVIFEKSLMRFRAEKFCELGHDTDNQMSKTGVRFSHKSLHPEWQYYL